LRERHAGREAKVGRERPTVLICNKILLRPFASRVNKNQSSRISQNEETKLHAHKQADSQLCAGKASIAFSRWIQAETVTVDNSELAQLPCQPNRWQG
jgi:hypothetical protein